jgi:serine/threonine protein kinase
MSEQYANSQIGDFLLLDLMKQRANIEMYRATQHSIRRLALFKMISLHNLFENDEQLIIAFKEHVRRVVALEHLHLQPIYGHGMLDEEHIYVVGRLISASLDDLLKVGALSLELSLRLALQIAKAMIYFHSQGLIHGSLSPQNAYVGEDQNIYLNDLELSPLLQEAHSLHDLRILLDVPFYASVEQLQLQPLDVRSDIYAFGAILYHMVTGKPPFSDQVNSFEKVLERKVDNRLIQPRLLNAGIPSELEDIIQRALRANPDERYDQTESMNRDLEQIILESESDGNSPRGSLQNVVARLRSRR